MWEHHLHCSKVLGQPCGKHLEYANQTYGAGRICVLSCEIKRLLGFKRVVNVIAWCWCSSFKNGFAYGKGEIAHTCFFPPLLPLSPPPSAESHYRNTISNTSAQVFDRLQTNLYSGGKQKAAEIYLLSVEERNKRACEPWVTSELTWRWISAPCKCMERRDILHSVIQHIAACRIPLSPTAGTIFLCCKNAVRSCSLRWIIL